MDIGICVYGMRYDVEAKLLKEYNINRTFIMSDIENFEKNLKEFEKNGIVVETLHSPFGTINDMWKDDNVLGERVLNVLKDSIDKCENYGIPTSVVHVSSGSPMPKISACGVERYLQLFEYADKKGINVALENLRYIENLKYFFDKSSIPLFCWDVGHENCMKYSDGVKPMRLFGNRLCALHIHDNRCIADKDDHLIPFDGNIDFDDFAKTIYLSGYNGTVMLELSRFPNIDGYVRYADISDEEYIKKASVAARKIAAKIESFKTTKIVD